MNKRIFHKKMKELLVGKKSLKERIATALFPALSLSFILFFFGPLDISKNAENYVDYELFDVLPACLILWLLSFLILFLICWLPGGKVHAWISSLYTGLVLAFYLQGNYFNIDLGPLDGEGIEWYLYSEKSLRNLAVFLLILLIPYIIHFYSRKIWNKYTVYLSLLLLIMQMVPLTVTFVSEYQNRPESEVHYVLIKDQEYVLGKENIVVFMLDHTGPEELSSTLEIYPDMLSSLNDFQQFDNDNSEYVSTFPAAAYMLTHFPYDRNIPYSDWLEDAWNSDDAESFYGQMSENGWKTRIFNHLSYVFGDLKNGYGKISNIEKVDKAPKFTINQNVFRKLVRLSYYRYFPLIMKAPFWIYTDELLGMRNLSDDEKAWNNADSLKKYIEGHLAVDETEEKVFICYHWMGSHWPFELDEKGRFANSSTSLERQLAGYFHIITEYLEEMKKLGIYDTSSIIITTDHGNENFPQSIFFIKPAGQKQDKLTVSHAPISQADFMETIAEMANLNKGQFGRSVFDVPEDDERSRCVSIRWADPEFEAISGRASNAMKDLCYIGDSETVHEMLIDGEYESTPLMYPFY